MHFSDEINQIFDLSQLTFAARCSWMTAIWLASEGTGGINHTDKFLQTPKVHP